MSASRQEAARRGRGSGGGLVYILLCRDGSLYTGATTDLERRLERHRCGKASKYTRSRLPVTLLWTRRFPTFGLALREEHRIKALTRAEKDELLARAAAAAAARRRPRSRRKVRPSRGRSGR